MPCRISLKLLVGRGTFCFNLDDHHGEDSSQFEVTFKTILESLIRRLQEIHGESRLPPVDPWPLPENSKLVVKGKVRHADMKVAECLGKEKFAQLKDNAEHSTADQIFEAEIVGRVFIPETFTKCLNADKIASGEPSEELAAKASTPSVVPVLKNILQNDSKEGNDIDGAVRNGASVIVQHGSNKVLIKLQSGDKTIGDLKKEIENSCGIPARHQKLLLQGKLRTDEESLNTFNSSTNTMLKAKLCFSHEFYLEKDGFQALEDVENLIKERRSRLSVLKAKLTHRLFGDDDTIEQILLIDLAIDELEDARHRLESNVVNIEETERRSRLVRQVEELIDELARCMTSLKRGK